MSHETEKMGTKDASSEEPPPSQENTTISDEAKAASRSRDHGAHSLGGYRAADDYRAERFIPSSATAGAFTAAQSFDPTKDNLYLCGSTGSGKSHLAAVAARRSFQRIGSDWMDRVRTYTPMQISRLIRSCPNAEIEQDALNRLIEIETLVLEDLGAQKDTEFIVSVLYEIINGRYQNQLGGLVVTSNLTLGDLARKMGDDRISSRLSEMCDVFNLSGEADHRPRKNKREGGPNGSQDKPVVDVGLDGTRSTGRFAQAGDLAGDALRAIEHNALRAKENADLGGT